MGIKKVIIMIVLILTYLLSATEYYEMSPYFKNLTNKDINHFIELLNKYCVYPGSYKSPEITTQTLWRIREIFWSDPEKRELSQIILKKYDEITNTSKFLEIKSKGFPNGFQREINKENPVPTLHLSITIDLLQTLLYLDFDTALDIESNEIIYAYNNSLEETDYYKGLTNLIFSEINRNHYSPSQDLRILPKVMHNQKLYLLTHKLYERIKKIKPDVIINKDVEKILLENEVSNFNDQRKSWELLSSEKKKIITGNENLFMMEVIYDNIDPQIILSLAKEEKDNKKNKFYKEMLTMWVQDEMVYKKQSVRKDLIEEIKQCLVTEPKLDSKTLNWFKKFIEENKDKIK